MNQVLCLQKYEINYRNSKECSEKKLYLCTQKMEIREFVYNL